VHFKAIFDSLLGLGILAAAPGSQAPDAPENLHLCVR
jgi:hypothetical protein